MLFADIMDADDGDDDFSTCISHGPFSFRTFDNMEFLSGGYCSYVLYSDGVHQVHMQMHHCSHFETCKKVGIVRALYLSTQNNYAHAL